MQKERITTQKVVILDYLKSNAEHPSAQKIYLAVKKRLPRISLGTVYRNLKNLRQKMEIQEIPSVETRYDGDTCSHAHFICQRCNRIFDIFDVCRECSVLRHKTTKVGKIKHYQIYFYGLCKKCLYKGPLLSRL